MDGCKCNQNFVDFDTVGTLFIYCGLEFLCVAIQGALPYIWLHAEDLLIVSVNCWHGVQTGSKEMNLGMDFVYSLKTCCSMFHNILSTSGTVVRP